MFAVKFYASCFDCRGNSIGKKLLRLHWEKAAYQLLFMLANTLIECFPILYDLSGFKSRINRHLLTVGSF